MVPAIGGAKSPEPTGDHKMAEKTTHAFQAEVSRVLGLVINSLYSNPEIFLRELVSNASDALDKLRFRALTEPGLVADQALRIRLQPDEDALTLTISDTGVGMTREELETNLGTIAHSGSQDFLKRLEEAKDDVSLIGQFGVGFYSAYLVADRVTVVTRAAGSDEAFRWESDATESFTIEPADRSHHGTDIVLHLKEDAKDYLDPFRLRELVKRYSNYVGYPIELEKSEGEDDAKSWEQVNEAQALWERAASEIKDDEYEEFYKHLTHDWEPPLARRHFKIEGTQLFTGLLFVPKRPPFDLFSPDAKHGIRLHVKRVFIMDDAEALLPKWLRFVRGVVDSEDLPLNVSREILQDSRVVRTIRKQIVKQSLDMLEDLAKGDDYVGFWANFGAVLKEGLYFEADHKKRIAKLCRFETTAGELTSLTDYVGRMKEGQEAIYYALGPSRTMLERAPHLEGLTRRGFEVLLMTDAVDQWAVDGLGDFEGKKLINVMTEKLDLDEDKDDATKDAEEASGSLLKRFRSVLQDKVSEVRASARLADSPVCLVIPDGGLPPYIERLVRLQQQELPSQKRILEVNPTHPLVGELRRIHEQDESSDQVEEWIQVLYDQALLAEGSPLEDPSPLLRQLSELMTQVARSQGSQAGAEEDSHAAGEAGEGEVANSTASDE